MRRIRAPLAVCVSALLPWASGAERARTRVIRDWPDDVVADGRTVRGRIEIVFDYGSGLAREVSRGPDGREVARRLLPAGFQPAPCAEELAEARDAVRGDGDLLAILRRTGGELEDGVLFHQPDGPCGPGSRCLLIRMTTADRAGIVRSIVYNLASQAFVHRDHSPASATPKP